jgi:S-adenosylmethionine synthetase
MALSRYNSALTEDGFRTNPESQYFERKGRETKPSKIANELIGMLNAGGGTLVYGMAVAEFEQLMPLSGQTIRLNLKHLIELRIVARLSEKIRDPHALYRFLNK